VEKALEPHEYLVGGVGGDGRDAPVGLEPLALIQAEYRLGVAYVYR
jgi:hypothetical protein